MLRYRHLTVLVLLTLTLTSRCASSPGAGGYPIAGELIVTAMDRGAGAAIEQYVEWRKNGRPGFDLSFRELEFVGSRLVIDGYYKDAIEIFEYIASANPRDAKARVNLADAFFRNGERDAARAHYRGALSLLSGDLSLSRSEKRSILQYSERRLQRIRNEPMYRELCGLYETLDGETISISMIELDIRQVQSSLRMVNLDNGDTRILTWRDEQTFDAGTGYLLDDPIERTFHFADRGGEMTLEIEQHGMPPVAARRTHQFRQESVRFNSDQIELAGALSLPDGNGPYPAVVLVHGSGSVGRDMPGFGELSHLFLRQGVAVLRYDKRGVGESKGNWRLASFDNLATDTEAAVSLLRSRSDIHPEAIGLLGFSQGAWISTIAAANDPRISWLILVSGGAIPPSQQEAFRVQAEMRAAGYDESEVRDAAAYMRLKLETARTGRNWEEFVEAARILRGRAWFPHMTGTWARPSSARFGWEKVLGHDPVPSLERIAVPILGIFGGLDTRVPAHQIVEELEKRLGDRVPLTVHILLRANHLMLEATTGDLRENGELLSLTRYVPEFLSLIDSWAHSVRGARNAD